MPAPTVEELRDFETQLEEMLAAVLAPFAAAPYGLQLIGQGSTSDQQTPRLEYEISLSEPVGPAGANLIRPETGAQTAFAATISFRHVYDHTKVRPSVAGQFRGALRTRFSPEIGAITPANLPWLEVAALTETSSARGRFKEDSTDRDLTEWVSIWSLAFMIRPDAWPS